MNGLTEIAECLHQAEGSLEVICKRLDAGLKVEREFVDDFRSRVQALSRVIEGGIRGGDSRKAS
jgi:hypothetical protein